jgi:hypothetical protein
MRRNEINLSFYYLYILERREINLAFHHLPSKLKGNKTKGK